MPFIKLDSGIPEVLLGSWHVQESEIFFLTRVKLYENEWKRLSSISHPHKRLEYLSSRLCMKELLKIANHMRVESLNNANGQPYLSDHSHYISYTHSGDYSAVIASPLFEVGIDIESLTRKRNLNTRFLFLNEEEIASFDRDPSFERFILAWSAKETLYKIFGQRGISFKHNIHLQLDDAEAVPNGIVTGIVHTPDTTRTYEIHFQFHPEFILTYTVGPQPLLQPEAHALYRTDFH